MLGCLQFLWWGLHEYSQYGLSFRHPFLCNCTICTLLSALRNLHFVSKVSRFPSLPGLSASPLPPARFPSLSQSRPCCSRCPPLLLGRPQPSQSVIVLSSQFHSSSSVFLIFLSSDVAPALLFRLGSAQSPSKSTALQSLPSALAGEATAVAVSHHTVLAVPLLCEVAPALLFRLGSACLSQSQSAVGNHFGHKLGGSDWAGRDWDFTSGHSLDSEAKSHLIPAKCKESSENMF